MKSTYTLLWKRSAEDRLADIWLAADDRDAVTRAVDEFERKVRWDPHSQGESRSETTRIDFVPPLAFTFDIDDDDRKVIVLAVHYHGPGM